MANSKPVTEIPRFLLPRLTWSTTALPRSSPVKPSLSHVRRRLQTVPSLQTTNKIREIHTERSVTQRKRATSVSKDDTSPTRRHFSNISNVRRTSNKNTTTVTKSIATSTPLRYNGVYAAVFKPAHRAFSTTTSLSKSHHFDTLKFVQRLKSEGFNEAQAVAMMRVLNDVIEESIQNLTRTMVLKEDAERSTYTQKVDFAKLRSELANADSSELQLTRSSHEKLTSDLAKLNSRLRDEIGRTQASVRLDLNLEKGRIREEANAQEMKIKETEARIEQEVAGLRERVEAVKFSTLQWLMGVCTGTAALILGAWRLLM